MTCKDCLSYGVCHVVYDIGEFQEHAEVCESFKNKADFVEVVRCEKCKHGDVAIFSKTIDGEETIGCYCNLKKAVTDVDGYCEECDNYHDT